MKKYIILFLLAVLWTTTTYAQDQEIVEVSGTVTDEQHDPLIGVSVTIKGVVGKGAVTDIDGKYTIKVPLYSHLVYSYIGLETQEVFVKEKKIYNVVLKEDKKTVLDEVTVTGTGVQKKITLTGAVTTVDTKDLRTPTASISNSFAGVVPGVFARQTTGQPGDNVSEFWIRGISTFGAGQSALVLVDGFERNLNDINIEDIETFTVLKDASATAIYGSRGANGVLLFTTKRGRQGNTQVRGKVETSYSTQTVLPKFVNGPTYARMMNEALTTRNEPAAFTDDDIYLFESQLDPEVFPDVNWMDMILKKGAPTYRANIDVNGGGNFARYFVSASYVNEGGMYETDKALKDYDTNSNYNRFNYRMNVDMDLSKTTLLKVGVSGSMEKQNKPGANYNWIWRSLMEYNPITTPLKYKNGRWGSSGAEGRNNPWVLVTQSGYNETWKSTVQTTATLEQDFRFITPGLKFIGRYGFDIYTRNGNNHSKSPEGWRAERLRNSAGEIEFRKLVNESLMTSNPYSNGERKEYLEAELHYERAFGDHQTGAVLKYTQDKTINNSEQRWLSGMDRTIAAIERRHQGIAGRFTYGWKYRYYFDFNFGYNGSENFASGHQFGFFPAYSVAWNLGEEPLVKQKLPWVNMFKIRYSYGKVGNDYLSTRFPYQPTFYVYDSKNEKSDDSKAASRADYMYGDVGTSNYYYKGLYYKHLASKEVTWEVATKHDLGLDFYFFGNKVSGTIDYFHEQRDGIYMGRGHLPQSIGVNASEKPSANIGSVVSKGFDGNLAFTQQIGEVDFTLRGNFTYSKSEILEYDEAYSHYPYTQQAGFRVGQARGLIAEGLFKDYEDIRYHANQDGLTKEGLASGEVSKDIAPGDIKYKDVNGDGVIDKNDVVPIGATVKPNLIYGFGFSASWKGLDFNVLFQGVGKSSFFIGGYTVYPFTKGSEGNILTDVIDNYWSLGKNEDTNAKYPRLSYGGNRNNYRRSTYWLRDGSYLRLKNLDIGYTLPKRVVTAMRLNNVRIYLMGTNLLTFSKFNLWDPEMGSSDGQRYPLARTYTLGITFSL